MYYHCIGCVMMKVSQCDILEFIAFDHIDCGMEDKDFFVWIQKALNVLKFFSFCKI